MNDKTLSQESCDDVVSREAVLKLKHHKPEYGDMIYAFDVEQLPSVTQKSGKWIQRETDNTDWWECSECGAVIYSEHEYDMNEYHRFCGRCGAKMVEPQESEDKE